MGRAIISLGFICMYYMYLVGFVLIKYDLEF